MPAERNNHPELPDEWRGITDAVERWINGNKSGNILPTDKNPKIPPREFTPRFDPPAITTEPPKQPRWIKRNARKLVPSAIAIAILTAGVIKAKSDYNDPFAPTEGRVVDVDPNFGDTYYRVTQDQTARRIEFVQQSSLYDAPLSSPVKLTSQTGRLIPIFTKPNVNERAYVFTGPENIGTSFGTLVIGSPVVTKSENGKTNDNFIFVQNSKGETSIQGLWILLTDQDGYRINTGGKKLVYSNQGYYIPANYVRFPKDK